MWKIFLACAAALAAQPIVAVRVDTDRIMEVHNKTKTVRIKAYWMRHGFSCANVMKEELEFETHGMLIKKLKNFVRSESYIWQDEPLLTDCAVVTAESTGPMVYQKVLEENEEYFKKGKKLMVFSSVMIRAMETALYNFPQDLVENIYPIPYISEKMKVKGVATNDNVPLPWPSQLDIMEANSPQGLLKRIKFVPGVTSTNDPDRAVSSMSRFSQRFPSILVDVAESLGQPLQAGDEVPIVIVSHSNFMKAALRCGSVMGRKPRNNEVWLQGFDLDLDLVQPLVPLPVDSCELLPESVYPQETSEAICTGTVARCPQLPEALLLRDKAKCRDAGQPICF